MNDDETHWQHRPETPLSPSLPRRMRQQLTPHEVKLWNWLREGPGLQGYHFRRQVAVGRFIADFACLKARLIVELDGGQHGLSAHQAKDQARDQYLEQQGFKILRFWNHEIDREKQSVMDTVHAALTRDS
jgi:very-short-patch-repair endonuclease